MVKSFYWLLEEIRLQKASGDLAIAAHLEELKNIRQVIANLNRGIRNLSQTDDYRENVHFFKTIPGISTLTAMTLLTEIYDINRFKNIDHLLSYVGLVPNTNSSGEKEHKTGMTNWRNPQLRCPADRKRLGSCS